MSSASAPGVVFPPHRRRTTREKARSSHWILRYTLVTDLLEPFFADSAHQSIEQVVVGEQVALAALLALRRARSKRTRG